MKFRAFRSFKLKSRTSRNSVASMLCIYLAVDTFRDEHRQEYQALDSVRWIVVEIKYKVGGKRR